MLQTGTPSLFFKVATSPRVPLSFRSGRSYLSTPLGCAKGLSQLPVHTIGWRYTSGWAWTPWEPIQPKDKQTPQQVLPFFCSIFSVYAMILLWIRFGRFCRCGCKIALQILQTFDCSWCLVRTLQFAFYLPFLLFYVSREMWKSP